jgi:TolA-binding protein
MKVRQMVAASMIGTVGVLAAPGIASARTAPSAQNTPVSCANASARVSRVEARITKLEQRITTLQTRKSEKQGGSAKSMQKRVDKATQKHDHLSKIISEIQSRCAT